MGSIPSIRVPFPSPDSLLSILHPARSQCGAACRTHRQTIPCVSSTWYLLWTSGRVTRAHNAAMTLKRTLPESPYWSPPSPVWTMDPWHVPDRPARSVSDWVRGGRTERTLCCERRTGAVHKNNCVSGRPAGWLKKVRLEIFLKFFPISPPKNGQYFHEKKKWKKKKIAAAPLPPAVQETDFFYGQPGWVIMGDIS